MVRRRSAADTIATVVLFTALLMASVLSVAVSLVPSLWMMMPICSDNCDTPEIARFDHRVMGGVTVIWVGAAVAVLLAGIGAIVAGVRRWVMWIWPAIGLVIVVVCFVVAGFMWLDALPSG
ncbi:hypothetical protein A5707_09370 [Mycobacterium kyorinense]|uniref:Uncharacterized protein n=1 Tax=Mycobacterium kyorinense TaxID=487514 RepID=A0A1A2YTN7_9MYCO|nr:hypothetical protein A5707_09370 [Mycobacterium kyorinense]